MVYWTEGFKCIYFSEKLLWVIKWSLETNSLILKVNADLDYNFGVEKVDCKWYSICMKIKTHAYLHS